jgi:hypothetical protein
LKTNDVLCGRDIPSNTKHPGNCLFRRLIKANKEFYKESVNSSYKCFLVTSIIATIQNKGGRFVRKEGGTWSNLSHKDTCLKTEQALKAPDWCSEKDESSVASLISPFSSKSRTKILNQRKKASTVN